MPVSRTTLQPEGLDLSRFIAGYWRVNQWKLSDQELLALINQSLELGITAVDHAMVYRSEAPFGRALALQPELREHLQIITKFGIRPTGFGELGAQRVNHYDSSAAAILKSVEASLRDLQTDYIDLLLVHRPDYLMEVEEVVTAFAQLKEQGKVQHFGVSNFNPHQFELLNSAMLSELKQPLATNQIEFSPLQLAPLESGVFEQCARLKCRPMLWSCLAGGMLLSPSNERQHAIVEALQSVADDWQQEHLEPVVYAWCLALPCRPLPLLGTRNIERMKIAISAENITLDREQWYRIWEAAAGHPVP